MSQTAAPGSSTEGEDEMADTIEITTSQGGYERRGLAYCEGQWTRFMISGGHQDGGKQGRSYEEPITVDEAARILARTRENVSRADAAAARWRTAPKLPALDRLIAATGIEPEKAARAAFEDAESVLSKK